MGGLTPYGMTAKMPQAIQRLRHFCLVLTKRFLKFCDEQKQQKFFGRSKKLSKNTLTNSNPAQRIAGENGARNFLAGVM